MLRVPVDPGSNRRASGRFVRKGRDRQSVRFVDIRRKAPPFRSAMSMLVFYVNRAGRSLDQRQRDVLERAKGELRKLYGKA